MTSPLSASAQRVQDALNIIGLNLHVVELPGSTRTAADAAASIGCTVAQIAKSLIFRLKSSDQALLVIASGGNRVDEKLLAKHIGEKIGKADADFVRAQTGFVIGGVPPVGHSTKIHTFIDEDLFQFDDIWAAAGTPNAVFRLTPDNLLRATQGQVIAVK
ncbi:MAG: YbaK/EbsC family protein [Chloroflexi bacterium]|jgi:prolyl-tRNA editing enzyme YbaK/EbsC (Cys-tRNA(Pro) deacylase)|nr:YbaK/EbsC family protein [Chloroflexota bacterium]